MLFLSSQYFYEASNNDFILELICSITVSENVTLSNIKLVLNIKPNEQ